MTTSLQHVNPGDLITARWMNDLIATVEALDGRLSQLEAGLPGTAPVITGFTPTGTVLVPARLTIHGRNFVVPVSDNTVVIDGVATTDFKLGSSDTALVIDIPPGGILPREAQVMVVNRNGTGSAKVSFAAPPPDPLDGHVAITNKTGALGKAKVGQTLRFSFELDGSGLNHSGNFDLAVDFDEIAGSLKSAWEQNTTIVGGSSVGISTDDPLKVAVTITVPPATAGGTPKAVWKLTVDGGNVHSTSENLTIEVGQTTVVSDPSVTFTAVPPMGGAPGLTLGDTQSPEFTVHVEKADEYTLAFATAPDGIVKLDIPDPVVTAAANTDIPVPFDLEAAKVGATQVTLNVTGRDTKLHAWRTVDVTVHN